jgi:hypothetical protein
MNNGLTVTVAPTRSLVLIKKLSLPSIMARNNSYDSGGGRFSSFAEEDGCHASLDGALRDAARSFDVDLDEAIRLATAQWRGAARGDNGMEAAGYSFSRCDSIDSELNHLPDFQDRIFEELVEVDRRMLRPEDRSKVLSSKRLDEDMVDLDEVVGELGDSDPTPTGYVTNLQVGKALTDDFDDGPSYLVSLQRRYCSAQDSKRGTNVNLPSSVTSRHPFLCGPSASLVLACDMLASQIYSQLCGSSAASRSSAILPHWLQEQLRLPECTPKDLHRYMPVVGSCAAPGGSMVFLTSAQHPASVARG